MSLAGHSQQSFINHGDWAKCQRTGGNQRPLLSSGKARRRNQAGQCHLDPWEGGGADNHINRSSCIRTTRKSSGVVKHGFTKVKSYLTNPINFYNKITGLVGEERAVDIACLDFSKASDTASHKILIEKLLMYRLDE